VGDSLTVVGIPAAEGSSLRLGSNRLQRPAAGRSGGPQGGRMGVG